MARKDFFGDPDHQPEKGELIRYSAGSTALAICDDPHAGGWHGRQCMGGSTFFNATMAASEADKRTWVACASFRNETPEKAALDIGFVLGTGSDAVTNEKPQTVHQRSFTDTPQVGQHVDPRNGPTPGPLYYEPKYTNRVYVFLVGVLIGVAGFGIAAAIFAHFRG